MCGILLSIRPAMMGVSPEELSLAAKTLDHRGTQGQWSQGWSYAMYHRRLPITGEIDMEYPYQPYPEDMALWLVGEHYPMNESRMPDYQTAWASLDNSPNHLLRGMYHAVTYLNGTFRIYTDPLGKKPLYHRKDLGLIASEIKALSCFEDHPCTIDHNYMEAIRAGLLPIRGTTPYKEIEQIPVGTIHELVMDDYSRVGLSPVYTRPTKISYPIGEFPLRGSVKDRISNVNGPVALLCSGGLDSSLLYNMIQPYLDMTVFHIENDESEYLDMLRIPSEKLVKLELKEDEDYEEILYYNESPMDLGSMLPQWQLGKAIKEHNPDINVVITGDGADELFAGYRRAQLRDTRSHDYNELIQWHCPRLDKLMMASTLEVRSPYMSEDMFDYAWNLSWEETKGKQVIKREAKKWGVPEAIINRAKWPLKSKAIINDKKIYQNMLVDLFIEKYPLGLIR